VTVGGVAAVGGEVAVSLAADGDGGRVIREYIIMAFSRSIAIENAHQTVHATAAAFGETAGVRLAADGDGV